jgi:TPR repeat protein
MFSVRSTLTFIILLFVSSSLCAQQDLYSRFQKALDKDRAGNSKPIEQLMSSLTKEQRNYISLRNEFEDLKNTMSPSEAGGVISLRAGQQYYHFNDYETIFEEDPSFYILCELWKPMLESTGINSNKDKAAEMLKYSADRKNANAQFTYAMQHTSWYDRRNQLNLTPVSNFFKYMSMASANGSDDAAENMIYGYEQTDDAEGAVEWLKEALVTEDDQWKRGLYQVKLSKYYEEGNGVTRNPNAALRLLRSAAEADPAWALTYGERLYEGDDLVKRDLNEARKYVKIAVESGRDTCRQGIDLAKKLNLSFKRPPGCS